MWFGTEGGGVCRYDGSGFTVFTTDEGLGDNTVLSIIQDRNGHFWFGTNGGGVSRYDGKSMLTYSEENGLTNNSVRVVLQDKNGNFWFGTNGSGACKFDGKIFTKYSENDGLSDDIVLSMFEDKQGNIWFGTDEGGACRFDGKTFTSYTEAQGLSNNSVLSMTQDKAGNMWFGTYGGGACRFDGKSFVKFTDKEGLTQNMILSMREDDAGNMWFGTYGGGVNRYDGRSFSHYTEREGLGSNTVRAIVEDKNGNICLGTYGDGIICYNGSQFAHYTENEGLPSNYIKSAVVDKDGNLWFGTDGNGVSRFDGKTFTNYTESDGLSSDYVFSMYSDRAGSLWFGTDGGGISRFDGNTLTAEDEIFTHYIDEDVLANNAVLCIHEDKKGNMWFGTDGGGAVCFDGQFFKYYSEKEGLSGNTIKTIYEDKDGNIWFGTDGNGISILDKKYIGSKEAGFRYFNEKDGLSNNNIRSILPDSAGNLWVATERGLNYVTFKSGVPEVNVYTSANGLKANNFFPNSALIDSKYQAWWGNGKALSTLDLAKFKLSAAVPKIRMNNLEIEQTFIDFYSLNDSLGSNRSMKVGEEMKKSLSGINFSGVKPFDNYPMNLELPYYLNHLTFHFSAIDWASPEKIRYQYMLEEDDDNDKEWSPLTTDNKILLSNLSNGNHTFKVRAVGLTKTWSDTHEYKFVIRPPWWKTWWAYALYLIVAVSAISVFFRWRTAQLRMRQKQLEQTVAERTAEVVSQKELVEEKQKEIVDSINYARRIQRALLASEQLFNKNLRNYFVLFQPKDIVSGDFYWASPLANGNFALVTADSTGHGVPGAMMSMLNISCLNEAINERKMTNPGDILNHVRQRIIESLSQDGSLEGGKDGMDCSVVCFDFKNKKLTYSAANNPVWIIRKNGEGEELIELKPDRMPVGKHDRDTISFSAHTVDLKEGDVVYTLTDGISDQFGGPKGKKFTYRHLKELLKKESVKPLPEIKETLSKTIDNWKGSLEQVDDMLMIGVKI
jgi:ligand-binding sensor domain-containing protein/serine phosphatase RsbU (regulator of sigma subunit)